MALVMKDRVRETTTTTGTGTVTLAGAVTGFQSFSAIGNSNTTYYTITNETDWEVGIGTYTSSGTTLSRDTILASSNSNNAVNWPAGTKDVFATYPAGRAVTTSDTQTLTNKTITNLVFDGDYTEEVYTISDGGSVDLDPSNGTIQLWTLGASRSPTATGFAAGQSMTLMINDGTAYAITWPSVTWVGGAAPTLYTTNYTVIALWKVSTTLYGALVGNA